MKIAIVIAGYMYPDVIGGAEIFSYRLSKYLLENGHEVYIIARRGLKFKTGIISGIKQYAYKSIDPPNKTLPDLFILLQLFLQLAKIKPDVYIAIMLGASLPCYIYSLIRGKPLLIRLAGHDFRMIRFIHALKNRFKGMIYQDRSISYSVLFWLLFNIVKNRSHFVVINSEMYNCLLDMGVKPQRLHLIFNPADEELFKITPEIGKPKLIYIGRLVKEKGVDTLIKALPSVIKKFPDTRLVIVGDGPEKAHIEELIKNLGISANVRIEGFVPHNQVLAYLSESSIFVLPSRAEGTPNVLLQAMAAGLPIIATNVGAIPELIKDGVEGYLIQPNDEKSLAKAIITLISDKEKAIKLGNSARKKAELFKAENIMKKYLELLKKIS